VSTWIKPGAKCVCIDDRPENPRWRGTTVVQAGQIYTVRTVEFTPNGKCALTFVEIINPKTFCDDGLVHEWGINASRFRPVVDQADDLALFSHHLNQSKELA